MESVDVVASIAQLTGSSGELAKELYTFIGQLADASVELRRLQRDITQVDSLLGGVRNVVKNIDFYGTCRNARWALEALEDALEARFEDLSAVKRTLYFSQTSEQPLHALWTTAEMRV